MVKINNSLFKDIVKIFITTWQVKFFGKKIIKVSLLFNSYSFWISLLNLRMADEHLATLQSLIGIMRVKIWVLLNITWKMKAYVCKIAP